MSSKYHSPLTDSSSVHALISVLGLHFLHRIAVPELEMANNNSES